VFSYVVLYSGLTLYELHPFSKLRDLPKKYFTPNVSFMSQTAAKNSKRKQTVKRHFKPYLIPKLNKNELE
jgi:hypothetical protein